MDETRHGEQSNNDGMHTETEMAGGSRFSINSEETSSVMTIKAVDDEGYKKVTKSSRKVMVIAILFGVPFAWLLSFWNFIISVLLCVALIVALLLAEKAATAVYKGEENAAGLYLGCFFLGAPIALVGVGVAFYFCGIMCYCDIFSNSSDIAQCCIFTIEQSGHKMIINQRMPL